MSNDIFEEKYKNNQLSSFERKLFEAYYPYKEQAQELATRLSASQERCEELAELLHKEEIHRVSDVQMQQLEIQSLEAQLEVLTKCFEPTHCPNWEDFNKCRGCKNRKLIEELKHLMRTEPKGVKSE